MKHQDKIAVPVNAVTLGALAKSGKAGFSFFGRLWRAAVQEISGGAVPALSMAEENRGIDHEAHWMDVILRLLK